MCKYYRKLFTCTHLSTVHIDRCLPACRTNIVCSDPPPTPPSAFSPTTTTTTTTTTANTSASSTPIPSPVFSTAAVTSTVLVESTPRPSHFPCFDCLEASAFAERAEQLEARIKVEADAKKRAGLEEMRCRYLEKKRKSEGKAAVLPTGSGVLVSGVESGASTAVMGVGAGQERGGARDGAKEKEESESKNKEKEKEEEKWQVSEARKKKGGRGKGRGGRWGGFQNARSAPPRSAPPTVTTFMGVWGGAGGRAGRNGEVEGPRSANQAEGGKKD